MSRPGFMTCRICFKKVWKINLSYRQKFCSHRCFGFSIAKGEYRNFCDHCKKPITRENGRSPTLRSGGCKNRFCSRLCFENFRKNLTLSIRCRRCNKKYCKMKKKGNNLCSKCYANLKAAHGSIEIRRLMDLHNKFIKVKCRTFKQQEYVVKGD